MKKTLTVCTVLLTFLWSGASEAALITSSGDAALSGATVDGFSSYAIGDPASVSDGTFTMTANGVAYVSVRDDFNGSYGIVGRSVVDYNGVGVEIDFASPMSAFGIHLGAADVGKTWTLEAFSPGGASPADGVSRTEPMLVSDQPIKNPLAFLPASTRTPPLPSEEPPGLKASMAQVLPTSAAPR